MMHARTASADLRQTATLFCGARQLARRIQCVSCAVYMCFIRDRETRKCTGRPRDSRAMTVHISDDG